MSWDNADLRCRDARKYFAPKPITVKRLGWAGLRGLAKSFDATALREYGVGMTLWMPTTATQRISSTETGARVDLGQ